MAQSAEVLVGIYVGHVKVIVGMDAMIVVTYGVIGIALVTVMVDAIVVAADIVIIPVAQLALATLLVA